MIQKFSRCSIVCCFCFSDRVLSCICSIKVNFASLLKSWSLLSEKCLHAGMVSGLGLYALFLWLFSRWLNCVSVLPTYCMWHFLHSMRYMTKLLLQVVLWNMVYDFLVCWLVNEDVELICLQHRLVILVRHGRHFPLFFSFFRITLLFFIVVCPIRSLRFLFLLYAMNGLSVKDVPSSWLIFNISQCLSIALLMLGRLLLNVVMNGILVVFVLVFGISRSSRDLPSAFENWLCRCSFW